MHRALPALLALAPLLAGCTGEAPAGSDVQPSGLGTASGSAPTGPLGSATAQGGSGAETAATAWVREFWGQDARKTLVSGTSPWGALVMLPDGGCFNCRGAFFAPADGMFVAPGAERVEVTATWVDPPTAPGLQAEMWYHTGAPGEPRQIALANGETLVLPVAAEEADAPFVEASQWWFWIGASVDPAGHIPEGDVELEAVVHRAAGELPAFPEPPDPWANATSLELLAPQSAEQNIVLTPDGWICMPCRNGWDATGIVPPGARLVSATVSWDWEGPAPMLWAWHAGTEEGLEMALAEDGDDTRTFTAPVPPEGIDSAYQRRSTWGFWFELDDGGIPAGHAQGTLTLAASVSR